MLALCYQEAMQENRCLDLLELQDASQHLSWKVASTNEVTFACYLANKLDIRVEWDPFHPDLIASAPDATLAALACQIKLPLSIQIEGVMITATCLKTGLDSTMTILAGDRQHSILLDGQAQNPGLPCCISRSYRQARWLYELPGMAADTESDEWADGVRTIRIPQKHLGIGIGTSRHGPSHCIISIQVGSMTAHNGTALVGELITHIDSIPTTNAPHQLHTALQGPEYTSVSLGIADLQGNAQTISALRSPSKTVQISWARAVKPLRVRRRELEKTTRGLTKDEEKECASLLVGGAAFVRLWPKLRALGFRTFDTIPRFNPTVVRTKFSCPILGSDETADTLMLTECLNNLREVEGHGASLQLAHARPTLLPSTGGFRESLIRQRRTLAQLNDHAEAVTHNDDARSILHFIGDQHSRDTGSILSTTQSGGLKQESSPMLLLGRRKHHCVASRLSSGGAQPTWIRNPSTTTSLVETHGTVPRSGSTSTERPCCLSLQLGRQTEPGSRL